MEWRAFTGNRLPKPAICNLNVRLDIERARLPRMLPHLAMAGLSETMT
jgi:hypothetical protein